MASKQFYLLGEAATTARTIEIPQSTEFEDLQHIVASHFAVVEPNGKNDSDLSELKYAGS
jgi:hypothetical protein